MDPFEELLRMADNAAATTATEPDEEAITRWTKLFNYTPSEAYHLIQSQRNDISREPISDTHWALVRSSREAARFDREAYEHVLHLKDLYRSLSTVIHNKAGTRWTLFALSGLLGDKGKVKEIVRVNELKVTRERGELGEREFAWLRDGEVEKIEAWLDAQRVLEVGGEGAK